eukprot:Pgem_evm1s650
MIKTKISISRVLCIVLLGVTAYGKIVYKREELNSYAKNNHLEFEVPTDEECKQLLIGKVLG